MATDVKKKAIIIGFDGLNPTLVNEYISKDFLPTFKKIKQVGVSGNLVSTIPPLSGPAWSSFVSGLNPGNHGIYDFITEEERDGVKEVKIHDSNTLKGRCIWDYLGHFGYKSVVINVPLTYPPRKINGIMVSGFPSPKNGLYANPKEFEKILRERYPSYLMDVNITDVNYNNVNKDDYVNSCLDLMFQRFDLAKYLFESYDWDLFFIVFTVSDRIQHLFWPYQDDSYPYELDNRGKFEDTIRDIYVELDKILGYFYDKIGSDTMLFVVSDHGFESVYKKFGISNMFNVGDKNGIYFDKFQLLKYMYKKMRGIGLDAYEIFNKLPSFVRKKIVDDSVAFKRMGGFRFSDFNISGPEDEKYEMIKDNLLNYVDEEFNRKVIDHVFLKEEIYYGEKVSDSLDAIAVPSSGYEINFKNKYGVLERVGWPCGNHFSLKARQGTLMVAGGGVQENVVINSDIQNVAPTILDYFNIKPLFKLDGRSINLFPDG